MTQVTQPDSVGMIKGVRAALRETFGSFASVFRNPGLRKLQFALLGSMVGDWASATALAVYVYDVGGAKGVGIFFTVRLLLMAFSSPFAAALGDRMSRKVVMIGADVIRASLFVGVAALIWADFAPWLIFILFGLSSLCNVAFRPAQVALMPSLADTPEQLTAANGTSSTIESLSFFVGPALGAFLLTATDVSTVFLINAATFVWSALLVVSIRLRHAAPVASAATEDDKDEQDEEPTGMFRQVTAGFGVVAHDRDLTMVGVLLCVQTIVAGAMAVFAVVLAVDVLHAGPAGVGYIDSVFGIGAVLGGIIAVARARRRRLAEDMAVGVILWGLPLVALWVWPEAAMVFVVAAVMGFGNPLVDVNFATLVQRITPDQFMARAFGTLEGGCILTMALGSFSMPFLIEWFGLGPALGGLGLFVTLLTLPWLPRARRLDRELRIPEALPLLEAIALFAPLNRSTVESLARKLTRFEVPSGSQIIREGQQSDRFYIIERGSVSVSHGDAVVRHETAGDFFGEIGLLRDIARTATITADEDTVLQVLERDDFLAAVMQKDESRLAAEGIVGRRIVV